jgi:hypothetical protein
MVNIFFLLLIFNHLRATVKATSLALQLEPCEKTFLQPQTTRE